MKNWTGNISWNPAHFFLPNSKEELKRIIEDAIEIKQNIRVIGSGHSFSPLCATSGYTISLDNLQYIQQNASDNKLVDIQGGAKLYQISEELNKLGLAQENMGDIDGYRHTWHRHKIREYLHANRRTDLCKWSG